MKSPRPKTRRTPPARARRPAWLKRPGLAISHVLVPLDFSGQSRQALKYAVPLARHFRARISLLHVVELAYPAVEATGAMTLINVDAAGQSQAAAKRLDRTAAELVPPELRGRHLVGLGSAAQVIIDTIGQQGIDLVVLSTKGRSGLARLLLGSTAERVVRHSPCPVLTVRRS